MAKAIKQLSAMDAAFLYQETAEMPMHVGSITVFKPPADYRGDFYETFKKRISERLDLAPILTWKLANVPYDLDHPSWVEDDQFNIDRHIFRGALPEPRNRATAERVAGWMHAKLLNRARPLWEFYVYDGLDDGEIIVYNKFHHAAIDGGAGAALMQIIYDATPEGSDVRPAPLPAASAATGGTELAGLGSTLLKSYLELWQQPLKLMAQWPEFLKALPPLYRRMADREAMGKLRSLTAPKTPLNRSISSERSFAGVTVSLARVKAVAAASGGKVNDVVLALSSGVLRHYLLEQGALPKETLTAMVPISLREKGDSEANNQVMAMVTSLASDRADPKARLTEIITESSRAKEMVYPFKPLMPFYSNASVGAPIAVQIMAVLYSRSNLADVVAPMANVVISNVQVSKTPLYAAGAQMTHMYPVSIAAHGMALNITVQGYMDNLDFGFIAGANVLPNVRELADQLPLELDTLEHAYGIAATESPATVDAFV